MIPEIRPINPGDIIKPKQFTLDNGIEVYCINAGTEDIVSFTFSFCAGGLMSDKPLKASTTCYMINEGTLFMSAKQLKETIDYYGILVNTTCTNDSSMLNVVSLNKYVERAITLAEEMMFTPAFNNTELAIHLDKRRNEFAIDQKTVSYLAKTYCNNALFGDCHPYGFRAQLSDFDNITSEELQKFHKQFYTCDNMYIIVAGKITSEILAYLNKTIGQVKTVGVNNRNLPTIAFGERQKRLHIPQKEALQNGIRISCRSINLTNPDFLGLQVVVAILGGFFGSRLMQNLREDKGYTYGIGAGIISLNNCGLISIATEVNRDVCNAAIEEIFKEIVRLSNEPVGDEELTIVKNYIMGNMVRSLDGPFALASYYRTFIDNNLEFDTYYRMKEIVKTISSEEIIRLSQLYLQPDNFTVVTAGAEAGGK